MKRKTAKDYSNDYVNLSSRLTKLDSEVVERLLHLVNKHPNAIIGYVEEEGEQTPIKAKTTLTEQYIDTLHTLENIAHINMIEKWIESQNPT